MQWTDGSGGTYGGDPYGGAGYACAPGHEGYGPGSYGADTATLTWDPAQPAQWTQPHPTAWDASHGDVLTVQAAQTPPIPFVPVPEPEPDPETPGNDAVRPVFVDSSGRRQRRMLRAARLLVIPAGGYVALLAGTLLGGPSISAPFVPQPHTTPGAPPVSAPDSASGTARPAGSTPAAAHDNPSPTAGQTPAGRRAAATAPAATSGTASPTATATPAPAHSPRGRAVGSSRKPVK